MMQGLRTYLPHSSAVSLTVLLFLALLMAGCAGQSTAYYVLNSTPPKQKHEQIAKKLPPAGAITTVTIREVDIPQYLDTPLMVSRKTDNSLKIAEFHQWGGQLHDNIVRTMADNLAERLDSPTISMAPFQGSVDAGISVLLDIRQFERMPDGYVHLQVQWHVESKAGAVINKLEHLKSATRVGADDYAGMASAMSSLLGRLSDHIAAAIQGMRASVKQ